MILAFASALAAAFAFGVASLLQEDGARRSPERRDVGLRLLGQFLRQPAFVAGTALDAAGFVLTFVALRHLPLFAVEATVSSAIAVTAVGSARRGERLGRAGRAAVVAVVVGLALIGGSALPEGPPTLSGPGRMALLGGVPALAAAGFTVGRRLRGPAAAPALGALAGLGFALFGVASRVLPHAPYVQDPLAWAALAYIGLGILLYGAALQRGPVTAVMASTTGVETVLPALVGLALADGARTGLGAVAAAGFLMTTVATLVLVRCSRNAVPGRPNLDPDLPVPASSSSSLQVAPPLLGM
jgi:drug/metabolite transporter (DMT)-like permease